MNCAKSQNLKKKKGVNVSFSKFEFSRVLFDFLKLACEKISIFISGPSLGQGIS